MYPEIANADLILLIPLSPEDTRKVEYLDDALTDGQWEVRQQAQRDAIAYAKPGRSVVLLSQYLSDVVVHLFDALDTVTQAEADEYASQAEEDEGVPTMRSIPVPERHSALTEGATYDTARSITYDLCSQDISKALNDSKGKSKRWLRRRLEQIATTYETYADECGDEAEAQWRLAGETGE